MSGVLAVVAAGLYMGSRSLDVIEPGTRLRTLAFWESAAFLLDGLLFLLIGVQVPTIIERIEDANEYTLAGYALLISAVVFGTRFLWMLVVPARAAVADLAPGAGGDRVERDARRRLAGRGAGDPDRGLPAARPRGLRRLRRDRDHARPARAHARAAAATRSGWGRARRTAARTPRRGCRSPTPRSSGSTSSRARRPTTSSSACATATAPGSSAWRRGWRAITTSTDQSDVAHAGRLLAEMIEAEREVLKTMREERAVRPETLKEIERELDLDESRLRARIRL